MRKSLLALVVLLAIGIPYVIDAMKSDEDKILELIHDAYEGFGNGSVSDTTACLAGDFVGNPGAHRKPELSQIMLGLARESRDEAGFKLRLVVDETSEVVQVDGEKASYDARLQLFRREKEGSKLLWTFLLHLELDKVDGWLVRKARYETESGRPGY